MIKILKVIQHSNNNQKVLDKNLALGEPLFSEKPVVIAMR